MGAVQTVCPFFRCCVAVAVVLAPRRFSFAVFFAYLLLYYIFLQFSFGLFCCLFFSLLFCFIANSYSLFHDIAVCDIFFPSCTTWGRVFNLCLFRVCNSYGAPAYSLDTGTITFIQKVMKKMLHVLLILHSYPNCTCTVLDECNCCSSRVITFFLRKPRFKMISLSKVQMWLPTSFSLGERYSLNSFVLFIYYISISVFVWVFNHSHSWLEWENNFI